MSAGREQLAGDVIELAQSQILASHHYLAGAIGHLSKAAGIIGGGHPFATDGDMLIYDRARIIRDFLDTEQLPTHDLLHTVLHCILLHPFSASDDNRRAWDLACDVCVERIAAQLLGAREGSRGIQIAQALAIVETACAGTVSAQKVYRAIMAGTLEQHAGEWEGLFAADGHGAWYGEPLAVDMAPEGADGYDADADAGAKAGEGEAEEGVSVGRAVDEQDNGEEPSEDWKRIARTMKAAIEQMPRERGKRAGVLIEEVQAAMRERVDYAQWLRRFAVIGEHLQLSDDEFDPVFYTYGLQRYGNLPLIEPLEQHEERRIRTFVIVIDTSQSVSGEAVRRFVDETCAILQSGSAFSQTVHVRIIQCDAQVQSDDVITGVEDLQAWGETVELRGFGGTDFRPAFEYVDALIESGELRDLGGLVYFTDGWGVYPTRRPDYKVAFVFHDDDHRAQDVPPWAVQVVLP